jgi:hypothetical protein
MERWLFGRTFIGERLSELAVDRMDHLLRNILIIVIVKGTVQPWVCSVSQLEGLSHAVQRGYD